MGRWPLSGPLPRGPLSVLRDNLTGLQTIYRLEGKTVKEYCEKLVPELKIGHNLAANHCNKPQQQYVTQYNLHNRDKSYEVGDHVIGIERILVTVVKASSYIKRE
jgi:hypothetical protein